MSFIFNSMDTRALLNLAYQRGFNLNNPTRDELITFLSTNPMQQLNQQMQNLNISPKQEKSIASTISSNLRNNTTGINPRASFNNLNNNSNSLIYKPPLDTSILNKLTPTIIDDQPIAQTSQSGQTLSSLLQNFRKTQQSPKSKQEIIYDEPQSKIKESKQEIIYDEPVKIKESKQEIIYDEPVKIKKSKQEIIYDEPVKIKKSSIPVKIPTPSKSTKSPISTDDQILVAQEIDPSRLSTKRAGGNNGPYKIEELKDFAKRLNIPGYSRAKKDELVSSITSKIKELGIDI